MDLTEVLKIGGVLIVVTGIWFFFITKKTNNESQMDIFFNKFKVKEGMTPEQRKSHNTILTELKEDYKKLKTKIKLDKDIDDVDRKLYLDTLKSKKDILNTMFVLFSTDKGVYETIIKKMDTTPQDKLIELNIMFSLWFKYKKMLNSAIKLYEPPVEDNP